MSASSLPAGQVKFAASNAARCLAIPVEAGTQYTLSNTNGLGRFNYGFSTSIPVHSDIFTYQSAIESSRVTENDRKYATFTTPAGDDGYIILYYYNSSDGVAEDTIRATVMLTKGSDRIPFEPYQNEKEFRVIKNDLNETGVAGQALMLDEDDTTLVWGTPTADVEIGDGTVTYPKLDAYLQNKVDQIGAITTETGVGAFHAEIDTASLGTELLDGTGWTGTGWTGDFANGFTPSVGADPLVREISGLVPGGLYRFTITTSNAHVNGYSDFYVSLGGSATFQTYKGGGASVSYEFGLVAGSSDSNLTITPINSYTGTITGMSLKAVSNLQTPAVIVSDTDDMPTAQILTGKDDLASIYFGLQSGQKAFFAIANTAVGVNALKAVTDGFWNVALGMNALADCIHGSRNVAIGFIALQHCVTGDRNIAIGSFALNGLTSGRGNIAIGADAMQTANGNYGIGIGVGANGGGGDENIAIGRRAGNASGAKNAIVGSFAMESASSGGFNVAVGYQAGQKSTGNYNINVGAMAGKDSTSGNNNILIGYNAQKPAATDSNTIVIGGSDHNSVIIAGKVINFNDDGTVTWSELS